MSKNWTVEEAKAYVSKVIKGKQQSGLKYCSAIDFLTNHTNTVINLHSLAVKEDENDFSRADK